MPTRSSSSNNSRALSKGTSFEQLKSQAKKLHKSIPQSETAVARVAEYFDAPETASLQQVQLVLAREYGFESWTKLKSQIVLAAHLAESPERHLADSILKTHDVDSIEDFVKGAVRNTLGWQDVELFRFELSVGAAFGLQNAAGERCLFKVLGPDDFAVEARRDFQRWLAERNFPCPKILWPVSEQDGRRFVIEEYNDVGRHADGHLPEDRRLMAEALYKMIVLSRGYPAVASIPDDTLVVVQGSVWPKPHNVYFDFEATTAGAEWIDEAGAKAKAIVDAMPDGNVLAHMDWAAKHSRIDKGAISISYDWDTVARVTETRAVGAAAAVFTYSQYLESSNRPSIDESIGFIRDYEVARGEPFTVKEREEIWACLLYTAAYGARCEHAIDHAGPGNEARSFLRSALSQQGYQ